MDLKVDEEVYVDFENGSEWLKNNQPWELQNYTISFKFTT